MKQLKKKPVVGICAANKVGFEAVSFAFSQKKAISFLATCDKDDSGYEPKIANLAKRHKARFFRKINTQNEGFLKFLRKSEADLAILAWWPSIVKKEAIDSLKVGFLNMHPSLLPYGRGKHPYYWTITEKTPFGATLHLIDEGVDTGPVVFQKEIPVSFEDTGESLYKKGCEEILNLFKKNYGKIMSLNFKARPQDKTKATFHLAKNLASHSHIIMEKNYMAADIINIIRGRTFLSGDSSSVTVGGKEYRLKLIIEKI
ncbi:MAG: formyltransferase family protein [bacterium]|nr:formyltransferase family protein [bacterium]